MIENKDKVYKVTNRSGSIAAYELPAENGQGAVRRTFNPGESQNVPYAELERLSYIPGGQVLIQSCFLIKEQEVLDELNIKTEPEYFYTPAEIKQLMTTGTLDEFLDCLDFAPAGVIQIIKDMAVALPLNDVAKRKAIFDKTGFNVDKVIANKEAEEAAAKEEGSVTATTNTERRVKATNEEVSAGRRTEAPKYTIINKE